MRRWRWRWRGGESPEPQTNTPITPKAEVKNPEAPKAVSEKLIANPIVEKATRSELKKPIGELPKTDLEKVRILSLAANKLTDVKGLENLTQLTHLHLNNNQLTDVKSLEKLTKLTFLNLGRANLNDQPDNIRAQIAQLQKALPKCEIYHDASK